MEQGGVKKIWLIENKDIQEVYSSGEVISIINSAGEVFSYDCKIDFEFTSEARFPLVIDYKVTITEFEYDTVISQTNSLYSLYGYSAYLELSNGKYLYTKDAVLKPDKNEMNVTLSNSDKIVMVGSSKEPLAEFTTQASIGTSTPTYIGLDYGLDFELS